LAQRPIETFTEADTRVHLMVYLSDSTPEEAQVYLTPHTEPATPPGEAPPEGAVELARRRYFVDSQKLEELLGDAQQMAVESDTASFNERLGDRAQS
jgi:hypothetical protein